MIKRLLLLFLVSSFHVYSEEQAITQWVYNTLERAQANIDKGNLEAAEKIYYDYSNDSWSSKSYDHFVILRTYAYFLISVDRNVEALRYLKQASIKRDMPPYDIFELHFTLGQIYYVTDDRENAKKTLLKWVAIGDKNKLDEKIIKETGYNITIRPLKIHRMTAVTDILYLEASTPELSDVVRLEDDFGR